MTPGLISSSRNHGETGNSTSFIAKRPPLLFSLTRDTTPNAPGDDVSEGSAGYNVLELQTVTDRLEFDECSDIDLKPPMSKIICFILPPPRT